MKKTVYFLPLLLATSVIAGEFEQMRERALQRKRLVIYNTDGCDAGRYFPTKMPVTPENLLNRRLKKTRSSRVDSVFYCPISSGFGNFTCPLKSADLFIKNQPNQEKYRNITAELIRQNTDPLKIAVDFCRQENLEIFVSIRVNDTHDVSGTLENPHFLMPKFKLDHPEYLMGGAIKAQRPPYCAWSAVDFTFPQVRDRMKAFVTEFLNKYDVDGIEYDFMRHMQLFRSVAWGGEASADELKMMTELMVDLRNIAEEAGRKRNRPILVAIRIPDSVGYCHAVGIDLETWLKKGVTDIIIGSSYFRLSPWRDMVELTHRYNVKFYASLDESRVRSSLPGLPGRNSIESYRARILNALDAGVDGIYFFNLEGHVHLKEFMNGNREELGKTSKIYYAQVRGSGGYRPDHYLRDGKRFKTLVTLEPGNPRRIAGGECFPFVLYTGKEASNCKVKAYLDIEPLSADTSIGLVFNGQKYPLSKEKGLLVAEIPATALRSPDNRVEVTNLNSNPPILLKDFALTVSY